MGGRKGGPVRSDIPYKDRRIYGAVNEAGETVPVKDLEGGTEG